MLDPSAVDPKISLLLNVSSNHAVVGHIIQYDLTVYNKSDTPVENVIIVDTLSPCLEFINGSVKINSVEYKDVDIASGIELGTIQPKESKLVSFLVKVISSADECNAINTEITIFYNYNSSNNNANFKGKITSNPLTISIYENDINITKRTSSTTASLNDVIKFTIYLDNTSHLDVYDVLLEDNNPNSTSLINGTFTVNGVVIENVNLHYGVNLGNIGVGQSLIVEYQVRVLTGDCNGTIQSTSSTTYNYFLPNGYTGTHMCYSNMVNIKINLSYSRNFELDNSVCLPNQCPDIDQVYWINGDLNITDWKPINSIRCDSKCPSTINGVRILVQGKIVYNFGYSTFDSNQEIKAEGIEAPFEGTIVLLCNYNEDNTIQVNGKVIDVKYQSSDERCVLCKTSIELIANV